MSTLSRTQEVFQRYVVEGADEIAREISGPDEAFRNTRLRIYYDAYRLRLIEALGTDYETLKIYVGDDQFDSIARGYIDSHLSTFRNVRWFGGQLPAFLRNNPRYAENPVLAELAEFEWALGLAFDAPDAPHLRFDDLAAVPLDDWPRIRFIVHPSLRTVHPEWNVTTIWHAINDETAPPQPTRAGQAAVIAIWRKDYAPHFRSLDEDETTLWYSVRGGATFSEACDALADRVDADVAPQRAAELLRRWVDDGWLERYQLPAADR